MSFARHCSEFSRTFPASHLDNFFHVVESSDSESESDKESDCNSNSSSDSESKSSHNKLESNESTDEKPSIFEHESKDEPEILSQELDRSLTIEPTINWIVDYIPFWGGTIIDKDGNKTEIRINNTCTIDYFLYSIWLSTKLSKKCKERIQTLAVSKSLLEIIDCIENKEWDKAKTKWLIDICNKEPVAIKKNKSSKDNNTIKYEFDVYGGEFEHFLQYINRIQRYTSKVKCLNPDSSKNNEKIFENNYLYFNINNKNTVELN